MKNNIKAIIFDFDGTLILGSEEVYRMRFLNMSNELGFGLSYGEIDEMCKKFDYPKLIEKMFLIGKNIGKEYSINFLKDFDYNNMDKYSHLLIIEDYVVDLLSLLKNSGIKIGINSNRRYELLIYLLKNKFNILEYFDVIIGCEDVENVKPNPEGINLVLQKMGIGKDGVYMVEDLYYKDIIAAKKAGVIPIYIEREDEKLNEEQKKDIYIFKNIKELYCFIINNFEK